MARSRHRRPPRQPKPTTPACPYCGDDEVYWRWNGSAWYPCDGGANSRHRCYKPEAVAEQQRQRELAAAADGRRKHDERVGQWMKWAGIAAAVLAAAGLWLATRGPGYDGPSDATAVCEDGTVSYAAHHQGACSWHGGVEAWNPNP